MALKAQYTAYALRGRTANGTRPNEHTCAAPKEIPFGTQIKVGGTGTNLDGRIYTVTDRGGAIKVVNGVYHIDLWLPSNNECIKFGRHNGTATIIKKSSSSSSTSNSSKKTSSKRDIIDVAIGEIGYKQQGKNKTKYGAWFGLNGAKWCHMFVSWCANQAGVSVTIVPKTASTDWGMKWFQDKGLFRYKGQYTPKRGDIVYFKTGRSHVGIVEKVSGNTLHTVEGNTSSRVARRTYSLSDATITGYGVPQYTNLNSSSSSSSGNLGSSGSLGSSDRKGNLKKKKASETELKYLKRILQSKSAKSTKIINAEERETNKLPKGKVKVLISNGKRNFLIPVKGGMKVVWERKGTPGKLTFEAKCEKNFKITEGNSVLVYVDGKKFFYGFIFSRKVSKTGFVSFTVYDQLRYLKNKETIVYKHKRADQVIRIIAERFNLNCGELTNTGYAIPKKAEEDAALFDIIQDTLDETMMVKNKMYVLYDKVGKLTLTDVADMKLKDCLIDKETGEDYSYTISIDSDVYNQIKLVYENKKKGSYDLYVAKDSKNINKWGVLQYLEKIDTSDIGKLKSLAYLKLYNRKQRNLTIQNVIGNTKVRAGSMVPVILNLVDIKVANYMVVEKVTHTFNHGQYTMDLVLSGGDFSG